jgi:hypothetical protein
MWLLAVAIFFGCKFLTWAAADSSRSTWRRQLAYLLGWPGMNADAFLDSGRRPEPPAVREWFRGVANMLFGALVFWNAQHWMPSSSLILLGWAGMVGAVLTLHFGSFQLISCGWRHIGIDARPPMNHPIQSTSVSEFWGRRWNTAFRDLTSQFLFKPLARRIGPTAALVIGFVTSGIIHDVVISVPAGGGYGGPTAFFCIQAAAILFERTSTGRAIGLGAGWRGWLFALLILLGPARLLFHDPFVLRVVVPFMEALGAA